LGTLVAAQPGDRRTTISSSIRGGRKEGEVKNLSTGVSKRPGETLGCLHRMATSREQPERKKDCVNIREEDGAGST